MFLIKSSDLSQFWTLWYLMILWEHQMFWKPEKELWFVIFKNMPPRLPLLWNWTGLNSKVGAAIHFTFTSVKLLYILHFSNLSARLLLCHQNYASLCNWATARSECNTVQYKDRVQERSMSAMPFPAFLLGALTAGQRWILIKISCYTGLRLSSSEIKEMSKMQNLQFPSSLSFAGDVKNVEAPKSTSTNQASSV